MTIVVFYLDELDLDNQRGDGFRYFVGITYIHTPPSLYLSNYLPSLTDFYKWVYISLLIKEHKITSVKYIKD